MDNDNKKGNPEILVAALEEYYSTGKVSTIKCDLCGQLIEIFNLGESGRVLGSNCSCGRYKSTMKGL